MNFGSETKKAAVRGGLVLASALALSAAAGESGVVEKLDDRSVVAVSTTLTVLGGAAVTYTAELDSGVSVNNPELEHTKKMPELFDKMEREGDI